MANSRLQYPSLDEKSMLHYFCLSNITSKYIFNSNEPDMICPLNWHLNLARSTKNERSLRNKQIVVTPLSVLAYNDTPECISCSEESATLEDMACYQLQCSLGLLTPDDEDFDEDPYYYDYEGDEIDDYDD